MEATHITQAVQGTSETSALLLTALRDNLQVRLAHQIDFQDETDPFQYQIKNPLPAEAVRFLQLMLRGVHQPILTEWLHVVHQSTYHMQIEVIHMLTRFLAATRHHDDIWVQPLRMALGEAGYPIVVEIWQTDPDLRPPQDVGEAFRRASMEVENNDSTQQMYELTERLKTADASQLQMDMSALRGIQQVWTTDLTHAFFYHALRFESVQTVLRRLEHFAYYFSLDTDLEIVAWLMETPVQANHAVRIHNIPPMRQQVEKAYGILEFRQRMMYAFVNGK